MIFVKTKNEFQKEVLEVKDAAILVDFYAEWCGPCKMMEPILEKFTKENPKVKVVKVNVDEAQELAMQYNVMSIPTLMVFRNGQVVKQLIGFQDQQKLEVATQ